jgi:hypothetical protein
MTSTELSGMLVRPIVQRVSEWVESGKLDEDELDRALGPDARAWVDHNVAATDWAPLADVEDLVALVAAQLGGETGLVEWAEEIVREWLGEPFFVDLLGSASRLTDGPGFVASQASGRLVRACEWRYEGGSESFSLHIAGVGEASPALRALIGACLARLAEAGDAREFDVRFDGVAGEELVIFGALEAGENSLAEGRLHRAALIA